MSVYAYAPTITIIHSLLMPSGGFDVLSLCSRHTSLFFQCVWSLFNSINSILHFSSYLPTRSSVQTKRRHDTTARHAAAHGLTAAALTEGPGPPDRRGWLSDFAPLVGAPSYVRTTPSLALTCASRIKRTSLYQRNRCVWISLSCLSILASLVW